MGPKGTGARDRSHRAQRSARNYTGVAMTHIPSMEAPGAAGPPGHGFLRLPSTWPGRWSLLLVGAAIALFVVANIVVASGQEGGDTIFDNLWISIPMVGAVAAVLVAGGFAGFAVTRCRERSAPVIGAMILGLLVLVFLVGEVSTPH